MKDSGFTMAAVIFIVANKAVRKRVVLERDIIIVEDRNWLLFSLSF